MTQPRRRSDFPALDDIYRETYEREVCGTKIRYGKPQAKNEAIRRKMKWYRCPVCGHYHLAKKTDHDEPKPKKRRRYLNRVRGK